MTRVFALARARLVRAAKLEAIKTGAPFVIKHPAM